MRRKKGYAHSTSAARCLAIKYPFLEAEVVFAVEQVRVMCRAMGLTFWGGAEWEAGSGEIYGIR